MIIGYQVQDQNGNNFGERPSFLVLSEETAISDLKEARKIHPNTLFTMIAILKDDIEEPTFEHVAMIEHGETYQSLALSTCHLYDSDIKRLEQLDEMTSADPELNMILKRDTGYFVKLYVEPENNVYPQLTTTFNQILFEAAKAGYRMVEFDMDAPIHPNFVDHSEEG